MDNGEGVDVSERSSGGPVLRKRGARQREQPPDPPRGGPPEGTTPATDAKPDGAAEREPRERATPAAGRRPAGGGGADAPPRHRPVGRRLYDPRQDKPTTTPSVEGDPARASANDIHTGWRKDAAKKAKPGKRQLTREKEELRTTAQQFAKDKGVPIVHAYRVLSGQATLNEVLKGMMRKERFEQLVTREGIDRELAGQVASGHLSKQRALVLTRMRALRGPKLHVDGITAAAGQEPYAVNFFGTGWQMGTIRAGRAYDFDFAADGAAALATHFKHDVKAICPVSDLPAIRDAASFDESVKAQGLLGTGERAERVRPDDEWMLKLVEGNRAVRLTMRDGEIFIGQLRSFGRWDADLVLPGGEIVTVFFHALHPVSLTLGIKE